MTIKSVSNAICILLVFALFASCNKNSDTQPQGKYQHGVFIVHEGQFGHGNSSISFYMPDSLKVINDIFSLTNSRSLGDVAQSITFTNNAYYIVVNNSNKIEVVDANFTSVGVIKDSIDQPRFLLAVNSQKAYVSQWSSTGKGNVAVLDLSAYRVTKRIPLNQGPEKMVLYNNRVYVTNGGGLTNDSTVSVIDAGTDQLLATIKVGYNPNSIQLDKNNKLWVLCSGMWKSDWSALAKTGSLVQIDPADNMVKTTLTLSSLYSQPSCLTINPSKEKLIYAYDNKIYEQNIDASAATIKINRAYYKLGVNPANGDVYATDPKNYSSDGWVIRYNSAYAAVDSFKVGIVPGEILFN
jgi:YVTN family beta-propeller protein